MRFLMPVGIGLEMVAVGFGVAIQQGSPIILTDETLLPAGIALAAFVSGCGVAWKLGRKFEAYLRDQEATKRELEKIKKKLTEDGT